MIVGPSQRVFPILGGVSSVARSFVQGSRFQTGGGFAAGHLGARVTIDNV